MDVLKIIRKDNLSAFKDAFEKDETLISYKDENGSNILMKAIFYQANKIATYLLQYKFLTLEVDCSSWDIYSKAVLVGNSAILKYLFDNNFIDNKSEKVKDALFLAIRMNSIEFCKILFDFCEITTNHIWHSEILKLNPCDCIVKLIKFAYKIETIPEPPELYPRDDLDDSFSMDEISPGTEYAVRKENNKFYCMGTRQTIELMIEQQFKSSSREQVFDLVQNKLVPLNSLFYCVKNKCPDVVRKIYNDTFTKEDMDDTFVDKIYNYSLLDFAIHFKNARVIKMIGGVD
jgi:hypothetical protein